MTKASISTTLPRNLRLEAEAVAIGRGMSLSEWLRGVIAKEIATERKAALAVPPLLARMGSGSPVRLRR